MISVLESPSPRPEIQGSRPAPHHDGAQDKTHSKDGEEWRVTEEESRQARPLVEDPRRGLRRERVSPGGGGGKNTGRELAFCCS